MKKKNTVSQNVGIRSLLILSILVLVGVVVYSARTQDLYRYSQTQSLEDFEMIDVEWKTAASNLSMQLFNDLTENGPRVWTDNANPRNNYKLAVTQDKNQVRQWSFWRNDYKTWPTRPVDLLEYPSSIPCQTVNEEVKEMCIVGMDTHFRQKKWWYRVPVLRYLVPMVNSEASEDETLDTYLSVYRLPEERRKVLSNPCPSKQITAYLDAGIDPLTSNAAVIVRCSEGFVYQGVIDTRQN